MLLLLLLFLLLTFLVGTTLDSLLAFFARRVGARGGKTQLDTPLTRTTIVTLFARLLTVDYDGYTMKMSGAVIHKRPRAECTDAKRGGQRGQKKWKPKKKERGRVGGKELVLLTTRILHLFALRALSIIAAGCVGGGCTSSWDHGCSRAGWGNNHLI